MDAEISYQIIQKGNLFEIICFNNIGTNAYVICVDDFTELNKLSLYKVTGFRILLYW